MTEANLRRYGWRPIVSEAQAWQLLRHEIKHHARFQQRYRDHGVSAQRLLAFKVGNWYKHMRNPKNSYCAVLIWRMKHD